MPVLIDLLRPNWTQAVSMDTIWQTEISVSRQGGVEERVSTVTRPQRVLNFQLQTCTPNEVLRLIRFVERSSGEELYVPLAQDAVEITTAYAGGIVLEGDFAHHRFYPGLPVVVASSADSYEEATIQSVSNTQIALSGSLSGSYPVGSLVIPLMHADINLDQQAASVLTDGIVQNQLTVREVVTDQSLPPYTLANDLTDFVTYKGYPVLPVAVNYATGFRFQQARIGDQYASGQGRITAVRAPFSRVSWSQPARFCRREEWDVALRFFSSRRGRLLPFYAIMPVAIWKVTNAGAGFVDVEAHADPADFSRFQDFAVLGPSGERFITQITAIVQNGPTWRLLLTSGLPAGWTPSNIRFATAALLCRFSRDSFREIWDTTELPRTTLEVQSLIEEMDFSSTIPGSGQGLPGGSGILSGNTGAGGTVLAGSGILSGVAESAQALAGSGILPGVAELLQPLPGGGGIVDGPAVNNTGGGGIVDGPAVNNTGGSGTVEGTT